MDVSALYAVRRRGDSKQLRWGSDLNPFAKKKSKEELLN